MRLRILAFFTLCLLLLPTSTVLAHTALQQSVPARDSVLSAPPEQVELRFSGKVEAKSDAVVVKDPAGQRVDRGEARLDAADATRVVAGLQALEPGRYTVEWRVVSADGHPISGSFGFTVGGAAAAAPAPVPASEPERDRDPAPPAGLLLSYWVALAGLLALTGVALARGALLREVDPTPGYRRWLAWAVGAALVGTAGMLVARTALGAMLLGATGLPVLARLALLGAAALLLPLMARRWWLGALLGSAGLLTVALGGHAAALEQKALGVTLDWLHLLAAAAWLGGLLHLLDPQARGLGLGALLRRFSPVAALSVAVLAGTGLYPALVHIPSAAALYTTRYGLALLVKLGLVAALLVVAAVNLLYVGPRLRRGESLDRLLRGLAAVEVGLLAAVLAAAALLTNVAPARVAVEPGALNVGLHTKHSGYVFLIKHLEQGTHPLHVWIDPHEGTVGADTVIRLTTGSQTLVGRYIGEKRFRFDQVIIDRPGTWEFRLSVERPGQEPDQARIEFEVP